MGIDLTALGVCASCRHFQGEHTLIMGCLVDACSCKEYLPPPNLPKLLTVQEIRRLGALDVEESHSAATEQFITDQQEKYKQYSKEHLIEELCRRDRTAIQEGRDLADGKTAGNLLREFVRGVLHMADHASLRAIDRKGLTLRDESKSGTIENLLRALGAEPSDNRTLRLEGSMLGPGLSDPQEQEELIQAADRIPQLPSVEVADSIRAHRAEHVAEKLNALLEQGGKEPETDGQQVDSQEK